MKSAWARELRSFMSVAELWRLRSACTRSSSASSMLLTAFSVTPATCRAFRGKHRRNARMAHSDLAFATSDSTRACILHANASNNNNNSCMKSSLFGTSGAALAQYCSPITHASNKKNQHFNFSDVSTSQSDQRRYGESRVRLARKMAGIDDFVVQI